MGTWSVDVFGSDNALDFICEIQDAIGIQGLYPRPPQDQTSRVRTALEHYMPLLIELAKESSTWGIRSREKLPVLAALFMTTGAAMSDELRTLAAEAARVNAQEAERDGWYEPQERERYMEALAVQIEAHQPGEIANVGHRGLFEAMMEVFKEKG